MFLVAVLRVMGLPRQPHPGPWPGDASMNHKDLVVHQVQQRQVAEALGEQVEEVLSKACRFKERV